MSFSFTPDTTPTSKLQNNTGFNGNTRRETKTWFKLQLGIFHASHFANMFWRNSHIHPYDPPSFNSIALHRSHRMEVLLLVDHSESRSETVERLRKLIADTHAFMHKPRSMENWLSFLPHEHFQTFFHFVGNKASDEAQMVTLDSVVASLWLLPPTDGIVEPTLFNSESRVLYTVAVNKKFRWPRLRTYFFGTAFTLMVMMKLFQMFWITYGDLKDQRRS